MNNLFHRCSEGDRNMARTQSYRFQPLLLDDKGPDFLSCVLAAEEAHR